MKKTIIQLFKHSDKLTVKDIQEFAEKFNLNKNQIDNVIYSLLIQFIKDLQNGTYLKGKRFRDTNFKPNEQQLEIGIEVEMEHTKNPNIAEGIALDHLIEIPDYYSRLIKAGLVDEQNALDLYKEYFV